jgi:hypothetical protein
MSEPVKKKLKDEIAAYVKLRGDADRLAREAGLAQKELIEQFAKTHPFVFVICTASDDKPCVCTPGSDCPCLGSVSVKRSQDPRAMSVFSLEHAQQLLADLNPPLGVIVCYPAMMLPPNTVLALLKRFSEK